MDAKALRKMDVTLAERQIKANNFRSSRHHVGDMSPPLHAINETAV